MVHGQADAAVVLLELDRDGLLDGRSNQEIADVFGRGLHRSTILRDLSLRPVP